MSKKCIGCGAIFQTTDINKDGYIKEENINFSEYCERCFRISHYGDYKKIAKTNDEFMKIIDKINDTKDLVILVVDLFNISNDYLKILNRLNNNILVVLTKRDLLPLSLKDNKLKEYIKYLNIKAIDSVVVSSNKNYNLDELKNKINHYKHSNNVYVIGFTNAGKSTLINKLIYNYSDNKQSITTSFLPSTTLGTIEIKLNDNLTIIDTPGIIGENSFIDFVSINTLKKITPKKEIKPITYQIKEKQLLMIEDLAYIETNDANVTFFIPNSLKVTRKYKLNDNNYYKYELDILNGEDIVLSGLGFIKCTKKAKVIVYTKYPVTPFTRKSLI